MKKGLFLLKRFNEVSVFNENKNEITSIIVSIVKLHENTKFNITKKVLHSYIKNEYKLDIEIEVFDTIYDKLKQCFKIPNLDYDYHETEDLYFEIKKIFPILKPKTIQKNITI
jgi:hypothetical protein